MCVYNVCACVKRACVGESLYIKRDNEGAPTSGLGENRI